MRSLAGPFIWHVLAPGYIQRDIAVGLLVLRLLLAGMVVLQDGTVLVADDFTGTLFL